MVDMKVPMASEESSPSLGVLGILKESLKIPSRNAKLMGSITLLVLLPVGFLTVGMDLALHPVIVDMTSKMALFQDKDPDSPEAWQTLRDIGKDLQLLLGLEFVFIVLFAVISFFSIVATVYSSSVKYSGVHLGLKDLFQKIGRKLKRPMITGLYISLLSTAYVFVILVLFGILITITKGVVFIVLGAMVGLFATLFYIYLSALWMLGIVASIIEDDCYGMKAIGKARELVQGRKIQGFVLMVILSLLSASISMLLGFSVGRGISRRPLIRVTIMVAVICLTFLVKLFVCMVYTVFYHECKKSHGEEVEVEGGIGYTHLPSDKV